MNVEGEIFALSHTGGRVVAFCIKGEREDRAASHERRELFISSAECLKSVAMLAKGAYRYSYRNASTALGGYTLKFRSGLRCYNLYFALTAPFSLARVARSVIFQTAKPLSRIKGLLNRGQKPVSPRFDRQWNLNT